MKKPSVSTAVCIAFFVAFGASSAIEPSFTAVSVDVAAAGGAKHVGPILTDRPNQQVSWRVMGKTGTLASGQMQTDEAGRLTLTFPVPKVRAATHLAIFFSPRSPGAPVEMKSLLVLPARPFETVRKTIGKLRIGLFPSPPCSEILKRNDIAFFALENDVARGSFSGNVVVVTSCPPAGVKALKSWLRQLSSETCIVVLPASKKDRNLLNVLGGLAETKPIPTVQDYRDVTSVIWTDLESDWLGKTPATVRLAEPHNTVSLGLLAGAFGENGEVVPTALERRDRFGHHWLIWNVSEAITPNEARWPLLLRNSLLWAYQKIHPRRVRRSRPVRYRENNGR